MKKLTRKEIKEGLNTVPIDTIILGSRSKQTQLTKKEKEFAEQLVKTGNKTEAYRRAYDTKGKATTAHRDALKVASRPNVSTYIQALEAQKEVEEYLLPTRLRALAIHKLSSMALNDDLKPTEQLRALELVGKMTEVALFTERRELVHSVDSASLKAKLMDAVQLAIANSKSLRTQTKITAEDLLREIQDVEAHEITEVKDQPSEQSEPLQLESISADGDTASETAKVDPPPTATTHFLAESVAGHLHSIPHNQSKQIGEGASNPQWVEVDTDLQMTPIAKFIQNDGGDIS